MPPIITVSNGNRATVGFLFPRNWGMPCINILLNKKSITKDIPCKMSSNCYWETQESHDTKANIIGNKRSFKPVFLKPCFIYKKTKTLREFGIRATRYANYRVAVVLLVGRGNKSERVKRWKDNVKKEKIKIWIQPTSFHFFTFFIFSPFYGIDLPCLIRTWEKLGRRPWSFYIWTICLVKPMDKNNALCQYHLPIYPSID